MKIIKQLCDQDKKIVDYLDELKKGSCLVIIDHGLGDFLGGCSLVDTLKDLYPNINISIGANFNRGFDILYKDFVPLHNFNNNYDPTNFNFISLGQYEYYDEEWFEKQGYDYVFFLLMPFQGDPNYQRMANTLYFNGKIEDTKPYIHKRKVKSIKGNEYKGKTINFTKQEICAITEFGIKPPITKKWDFSHLVQNINTNPKLVCLHWNSNSSKDARGLTEEQAKFIWKNIEELGFEPFDLSMDFSAIRKEQTSLFPIPEWIPKDKTFRFYKDNLKMLIEKISTCQYFIGTDSGPMHLARNIIGPDRCFIIEKISPITTAAADIKHIYKLGLKGTNLPEVKTFLKKNLMRQTV